MSESTPLLDEITVSLSIKEFDPSYKIDYQKFDFDGNVVGEKTDVEMKQERERVRGKRQFAFLIKAGESQLRGKSRLYTGEDSDAALTEMLFYAGSQLLKHLQRK